MPPPKPRPPGAPLPPAPPRARLWESVVGQDQFRAELDRDAAAEAGTAGATAAAGLVLGERAVGDRGPRALLDVDGAARGVGGGGPVVAEGAVGDGEAGLGILDGSPPGEDGVGGLIVGQRAVDDGEGCPRLI